QAEELEPLAPGVVGKAALDPNAAKLGEALRLRHALVVAPVEECDLDELGIEETTMAREALLRRTRDDQMEPWPAHDPCRTRERRSRVAVREHEQIGDLVL